jgi:hypothetical protein
MTHNRNNIDITTQFVAQMLDFRQSNTNPEGLHRAVRLQNARSDDGKAGELNRHGLPGNRPSLAFYKGLYREKDTYQQFEICSGTARTGSGVDLNAVIRSGCGSRRRSR